MKKQSTRIISVHSRKGGVGKTSVALSAAVQLAALGKKVGWLDLDTQGSHLAQSWPFRQDVKVNAGVPEFQWRPFNDDDHQRQPGYSHRSYWNVPFGEKLDLNRELFHNAACRLSSSALASVRGGLTGELGPLNGYLDKVVNNLTLFPGSCYLKHIDPTNQAILTVGGQGRLLDYLTDFHRLASKEGFDFLVIDNSPGISIMTGNVLRWVIERNGVKGTSDSGHHLWFLGGVPWWEMGLIFYELNVMAPAIAQFNPVLVVNRVGGHWLGHNDFPTGARFNLATDAMARQRVLQRLMCLPIWLGSNVSGEQLTKYVIQESNLNFAILARDANLEKSMARPEDVESDGQFPGTPELQPGAVAHPDQCRTWVRWGCEFALRFIAGALRPVLTDNGKAKTTEAAHPHGQCHFSQSVYRALVKPLLTSSAAASA